MDKVLLIGLGGTGSTIVRSVAERFRREHGIGHRDRVHFVVIDTDQAVTRDRRISACDLTDARTVNQTVDKYRKPLNLDEWFVNYPALGIKPLNTGAAQVRQLSRLLFDIGVREGRMTPLDRSIQNIIRVDNQGEGVAAHIHIVGSLAGGTGSGLCLPVALHVKSRIREIVHLQNMTVRGTFLMPSCFASLPIPESEREDIRANAYATIKEYVGLVRMQKAQALQELYFERPVLQGLWDGDTLIPPYDFLFLREGSNANGETLVDFSAHLDATADAVYVQLFTVLGSQINSNEDNIVKASQRQDGLNRFGGFGLSKLVYPFDDILHFVSTRASMNHVSERWRTLDHEFERELEEYERRRSQGDALSLRPEIHRRYVELLQIKEGEPFFKDILDSLNVRPDGLASEEPARYCTRVDAFLDAIEEPIRRLSSQQQDIAERRERAVFSVQPGMRGQTAMKDQYLGRAEKIPDALRTYMERVERVVAQNHRALAASILRSDDEVTRESYIERNPASLNHYLSGPTPLNPIAARAFLYLLKTAIRDKLGDEVTWSENLEKRIRDQKESIRSEIGHLGNRLAQVRKTYNRRNEFWDSLSDYAKTTQDLLQEIDRFFSDALLERVLSDMLIELEGLVREYEQFFHSLDAMITRFQRSLVDLGNRHRNDGNRSNRYLFDSYEEKSALYNHVRRQVDDIALGDQASRTFYRRLYVRSIMKDTLIGQNGSLDTSDYDSILQDTYVENYLSGIRRDRSRLAALDLRIDVAAMLHDRLCHSHPSPNARNLWKGFFQTLDRNSAVNLDAFNPACSQMFACMPASVRDGIGADVLTECLGPTVQYLEEGFSPYEIILYRNTYDLVADALPRIAREGAEYRQAYDARVMKLLRELERYAESDTREVNPHIDKRWIRPTCLPDLLESDAAAYRKKVGKVLLFGIALGFITEMYRPVDNRPMFVAGTTPMVFQTDERHYNLYHLFLRLFENPRIVRQLDADIAAVLNEPTLGVFDFRKSPLHLDRLLGVTLLSDATGTGNPSETDMSRVSNIADLVLMFSLQESAERGAARSQIAELLCEVLQENVARIIARLTSTEYATDGAVLHGAAIEAIQDYIREPGGFISMGLESPIPLLANQAANIRQWLNRNSFRKGHRE